MQVLKKILIGLALLCVAMCAATPLLPGQVHVERSIAIDAPQATVFTVLNGYQKFNDWSPWAELDPDATYAFEGPSHGVGAKMSWSGPEVEQGSQEIVESEPWSRIDVQLDFGSFGRPTSYYALAADAGGTQLTWGFDETYGTFDVMGRWFGLLLDGMIGGDYERGLAKLKTLVEGLPKSDFANLAPERVDTQPLALVYVRGATTTDPADLGPAVESSFKLVEGFVARHKLPRVASPHTIAVGLRWDEAAKVFEYEAAVPVAVNEVAAETPVEFRVLPSMAAVRATHRGAPEGLYDVHGQLEAWFAAHGFEIAGPVWEAYLSPPGTPPDEQVAEVYYPIK